MKYKCLIVDHDDTSVDSTPHIHYPAFLEAMKTLRPGMEKLGFEQYMMKNFEPGFGNFLMKELHFDKDEFLEEFRIWRGFTERITP
jgi:hypothetical protein